MASLSAQTFGEIFTHGRDGLAEDPMIAADADMRHVLDALNSLGARPIDACRPAEARRQPNLEDAVRLLLERAGRAGDGADVAVEDIVIPGPEGDMAARLYRSPHSETETEGAARPLILYCHDGLWVTGGPERCDMTPRALAHRTGAIVLSPAYRLAPEHRVPAAHEDCHAAWLWLLAEGASIGGDPRRAAIVGEGAGGNIALNIALDIRAERIRAPLHLVLIHPIAGAALNEDSAREYRGARPVGVPALKWSFRHAFARRAEAKEPRIALAEREDLSGLPATTLVLAGIDPLRGTSEQLAEALEAAGVSVDLALYEGVTQGFFGLGAVVNKAMFAQSQVAATLIEAFEAPRRPM